MVWPALIAGAAGLLGGAQLNRATRAASAKQMKFQERMSSTAHQREVKDLRAAGLNPILSGTGGAGSSSPGGSMPNLQDIVTPAINSALQAKRLSADLKLIDAQTYATQQQGDSTKFNAVVPRAIWELGEQARSQGRNWGIFDFLSNLITPSNSGKNLQENTRRNRQPPPGSGPPRRLRPGDPGFRYMEPERNQSKKERRY